MKKTKIKNLTKTEKIKLVKAKFNIKNIQPVHVEDLAYRHKLYLLAIFRVLTDEKFDKILPLNNQDKIKVLSPSRDMDNNMLECLNTNKVIYVDSQSKIESFHFNNNECIGFNIEEVYWLLNMSDVNEERLNLSICFRMIYKDLTNFPPTSTEERNQAYYLTMNLALNEVENYLQFKSNELSYKYEVGKKTSMYVYQLLNFLSVSEIYSIIDKSIDEDFLYNSRSELNTKRYGNTLAARLLEVGELANRNETSLIKLPRNKSSPRSELSRIFYELIHHGSDEGFSECPFEYWNSTLKLYYNEDVE